MRNVMGSEPKLQDFYRADEGFAQYVDRHEIAGADLKIRNSYFKWELERFLAIEEYARIIARGEVKGKVERDQEIALNALRKLPPGQSMDDIAETLRSWGISDDIVKRALEQVRAE
jgi:hypothetical protein